MVLRLICAATAISVTISVSGCGNMLERPAPSEQGYLNEYFSYFDTSQIEKLDYVYKGAIGGAMTVGRAKFKQSVKLKNWLIEERIKSGRLLSTIYDPATVNETDAAIEQHQWENYANGTIPSWFDFSPKQKMRLLKEESEGSEGHPCFGKAWYIDEERAVVYVRASWG
jgi:hypothetical protein